MDAKQFYESVEGLEGLSEEHLKVVKDSFGSYTTEFNTIEKGKREAQDQALITANKSIDNLTGELDKAKAAAIKPPKDGETVTIEEYNLIKTENEEYKTKFKQHETEKTTSSKKQAILNSFAEDGINAIDDIILNSLVNDNDIVLGSNGKDYYKKSLDETGNPIFKPLTEVKNGILERFPTLKPIKGNPAGGSQEGAGGGTPPKDERTSIQKAWDKI